MRPHAVVHKRLNQKVAERISADPPYDSRFHSKLRKGNPGRVREAARPQADGVNQRQPAAFRPFI